MRAPILITNLKSTYCKIVFITSLIAGYLLTPKQVFKGITAILATILIILMAFTISCVFRDVKEKVSQSLKLKRSLITTIATALGLATLRVCGITNPMCGASMSTSIIAMMFPQLALKVYQGYGNYILIISIFLQLLGLYFMKCFETTDTHSKMVSANNQQS